MISRLVSKITRFLKLNSSMSQPKLGRWNTNDNQGIESILANSDHCGDLICKDPKLVSGLVKEEAKKI